MDTLDIQAFYEGFEFGLNSTLPIFGSLVCLGVLVFVAKKAFRI